MDSNGEYPKRFPAPIQAYDIHVYFYQTDPEQVTSIQELHRLLGRTFPKLQLFPICQRPVGPHVTGMFQGILTTPAEFGVVVPWLTLNRRGHSILVHPHTGDELRDHGPNAIWLGDRLPINFSILERFAH